jgi:hypothetical protein
MGNLLEVPTSNKEEKMHPQGSFKLVRRQRIACGAITQWILERYFYIPFVPFNGLIIKEPAGKDKAGNDVFSSWKIASFHEIQYVNLGYDGYFLIENCLNSHDKESALSSVKMHESQGWKLVGSPKEELPKEAIVVKVP